MAIMKEYVARLIPDVHPMSPAHSQAPIKVTAARQRPKYHVGNMSMPEIASGASNKAVMIRYVRLWEIDFMNYR